MRNNRDKPALKTSKGSTPLRSRGFLSHPGGNPTGTDDTSSDQNDTGKPNKSRGKRQSVVSSNGKPDGLATKATIRPYSLEDK